MIRVLMQEDVLDSFIYKSLKFLFTLKKSPKDFFINSGFIQQCGVTTIRVKIDVFFSSFWAIMW